MSKEEIALQLTLKALDKDPSFIGLYNAENRKDILEINAKNIFDFFNIIIDGLKISDNN